MKWIYPQSVLVACISILATPSFALQNAKTVFGLVNAQHFYAKHNGAFVIQVGSFSNKKNALRLQTGLQSKTEQPVRVQQKKGHYIVTVGPVNSAQVVRTLGHNLNKVSPAVLEKMLPAHRAPENLSNKSKSVNMSELPVVPKPKTRDYPFQSIEKEGKSIQAAQTNWYAGVGIGGQFPTLNSSMTVNNGSDFAVPLNQDIYSTNNNSQAFLGIFAGRRWRNDNLWLPAMSVGVVYEHFFSNNAGGTIMQYSLPQFTNYKYGWNISSDAVLATAKLNLFRYVQWSPFINGGIGGAFNTARGYNETAWPGVTPRVSPGFANNNSNQFAYAAGAGLDFQLAPQFLISVGYLYQNLGNVSSGQGVQTWTEESLSLGTYRSNDVFASITYLFGK